MFARQAIDDHVSRIVTLTTDFGNKDGYVAALKATILQINPNATLIDISHAISPHDVMEAAFVLRSAYPFFPDDTTHLVVVDPGVGTERRPLAMRKGRQYFVGPDNGLFALVLDGDAPDEAVTLNRSAFWRTAEPSMTFHGRDIFAPVAAHLSIGREIAELGEHNDSIASLHWALPISHDQGIQGWVVHIDAYGNCITNIAGDIFESGRFGRDIKCYVGNAILEGIHSTYGDVASGEPLVVLNSSGLLEIAVNSGDARTLLDIRKGASVNLLFVEEKAAARDAF